uniref:Type I polyketide synthase n=1 Tax=Gambierdiscus polynesiensis TaxID=439318 RepID=A0A1S6K7X1_9DINO|nr:type I polyketide synthase [Gambierdiscus polynesiensis]
MGMEEFSESPCPRPSLEGQLVEIFGVEGKIRRFHSVEELEEEEHEAEQEEECVDPNGLKGRVLHFAGWDQTYVVMTFDRLLFRVPEGNVREFEPTDPVSGGFDVVWPDGPQAQEMFALAMVEALCRKDFCVVQMWMSEQEREAVQAEACSKTTWSLPDPLIESAMLGRENNTKYHLLGVHVPDGEPSEVLQECDHNLTLLLSLLEPHAQALGCSLWGRMNGMLRMPLNPSDSDLRPATMGDQERTLKHLTFLERRKLLLMHLIDNSGGELQLIAKEGSGPAVSIPLCRNRLVVLRNDRLGFVYRPRGPSVLLQAWSLSEPLAPSSARDDVVELPLHMQGRRAHLVAAVMRYPGGMSNQEEYFAAMTSSGLDSQTKVPLARFDIDLYFSESKDAEGRSCTSHGAFISHEGLVWFDNKRFKITRLQAEMMSPVQRIVLEVGCEAVHQSRQPGGRGNGWGVFIGDSGSFWPDPPRRGDPFQLTGGSKCHTGGRLSQCLGLSGPCVSVDTACSSSLVALSLAHASMRRHEEDQVKPNVRTCTDNALAVGVGLLLSVREYISYSGPGMLSPRGRCFTFNASADGFARGEGCGSLVMRSSAEDVDTESMLACLVGSAVNQDGRSASMTAPHGPSQQMCIRASMQELELQAKEIVVAECHGTGTALGDPIEVGAIRMVMLDKQAPRETPILNTSAKSHLGHLEAAAGIAGVIKCVLSVVNSSSPPNVHFETLNPHMDTNGYPTCFVTEPCDHATGTSIAGVSSFGFGGTNARGDIWGRCLTGPRCTGELFTGSIFQQQVAFLDRVEQHGLPGPQESDQVYVVGSWDASCELWLMHCTDLGEYSVTVRVGETCREHFYIVLNGDLNLAIHPTHTNANKATQVRGPEINKSDLSWLIDGKEDGVAPGTIYEISFAWSFSWEHGEHMKVSWQPTATPPSGLQLPYSSHVYSITGTFTSWKFREMHRSKQQEGKWSTQVRIGMSGQELFQLVRDNDSKQVIYPAEPLARKTCMRISGPDENVSNKHWLLQGPPGEVVAVHLVVLNGSMTVTTASRTKTMTWTSAKDEDGSVYFVAGTWNAWNPDAMVADTRTRDIHSYRLHLGSTGQEEFQIIAGKERDKRLYPHVQRAQLGEGMLCGPDANDRPDWSWLIRGEPGQEFEVVLDFGISNSLWIVSWVQVGGEQDATFAMGED